MLRFTMAVVIAVFPFVAVAQDRAAPIPTIVNDHIIAGFNALQDRADALSAAASETCDTTDPALREAYKQAFLVWSEASHLRFGPTEQDNRGFALAFWPDPRGKTPNTLRKLILDGDAGVIAPDVFREQSVAIRGFYALDFLLFDEEFATLGDDDFRCDVLRAVAGDIATTSAELAAGWTELGADLIAPTADATYRTEEEVLRVLFKSVSTGMEFTADIRLARPLGTVERPRPKRAEARRSGLSRDLTLAAVRGSGALAVQLASSNPELAGRLETAQRNVMADLEGLDDPAFAGVDTPQGRLRVEAIQTSVNAIRRTLDQELGPYLGVSAGFNALDGD
ncbi:MAG: imelysin family protein [Pseudomonadota bacterium]